MSFNICTVQNIFTKYKLAKHQLIFEFSLISFHVGKLNFLLENSRYDIDDVRVKELANKIR